MNTPLSVSKKPVLFSRWSRTGALTTLTLLVIIGVGAAFRFHLLEVRGFNVEAASWTFARLSWGNFWKSMWHYDGHMTFYYILLRVWLVLGNSEWIVRSLSVLFGLATLPALYLLGSRLFGKQAGLISAALLAVHTFHIRYSQEARSYSLLTLLLVLSVYFFVRAAESPNQRKYWAAYLLVSVLACYSHVLAILVLTALWLSLGPAKLRQIGSATIVLVMSIFVLLTTPMGLFVLFENNGQIGWVPPLTWGSFVGFVYFVTGDVGNVLLVLYLALCLLSLRPLFQSKSNNVERNDERWRLRLVLLWLVVPFAIVIGASLVKPVFQPRFLLMCVPALALLAGLGITELTRLSVFWRRLSPLAFIVVLALSVWGARKEYRTAALARTSFRPMTQYVLDREQSQDAIFFFPAPTYLPFNYYAHRQMEKQSRMFLPTVVFPPFNDAPTGARLIPTRDEIEAAVRDYKRVWLVLNLRQHSSITKRPTIVAMIRETLQEQFQVQEERTFPGQPKVTVALYVRTTGEEPREQSNR